MIGVSNIKYPAPLMVPCAKCSKDIKVYTHQRAFAFCCAACGAYHVNNKQSTIKSSFVFRQLKGVPFKVGTVFKINNLEFLLINYLVKEEQSYKTTWIEYTLFHPEEGCLTLNESDGHYTLMKPSKFYSQSIERLKCVILSEMGTFQLYNKYKFKIKHAEGEFFKNILDANLPACADFVQPPYIVAYEKTSDEVYWFLGEYYEQREVQSWVKETIDFPKKEGVAPNQPFSLNFNQTSLIRLTVLSVFILLFSQIILSNYFNKEAIIARQSYFQTDSLSHRTYVSAPFEITKNNSAVDFKLNSPLSNNWLETSFTLVNETTGDQYYFSGVLEYYAGYTDGESWSEGSNEETLTVSKVTKGRYHFNVDVYNDITKPYGSLYITVIEDVPLYSNFVFALLCLTLFPAYIYYKRKRFDRRQWQNSDYSPYED